MSDSDSLLSLGPIPSPSPTASSQPQPATSPSAWAWSNDAKTIQNPTQQRFVSPFLATAASTSHETDDSPRSVNSVGGSSVNGGVVDDADYGNTFRFGGFDGPLNPRPDIVRTKSPIGPMIGSSHTGKSSYPGPAGIAGLKSIDSYGTNNDAELVNGKSAVPIVKEDDFLHSPYSNTNLASLTASPLSTPSFPSHPEISPSSPSESYSRSISSVSHSHSHFAPSISHSSQSPSRGEESFEALEKSLAAMIFSNSHPPNTANGNSTITNGSAQVAYGQQSLSASSTPYHGSMNSTALLGNGSVNSNCASPATNGSVAYIVMPNGQVQTVDMATIQQALQPGQVPSGNTNSSQSSRHPSSSPTYAANRSDNPRLVQPASQYPSYPATSPALSEHGGYTESSNEGDALSFSLETLSSKTLPLFQTTTPPPQMPLQQPRSASNSFSSNNSNPSSQPSRHPISLSQSHSPYSSPNTGSMSIQQRAIHRQQQSRNGSVALLHDYTPSIQYSNSTNSPAGSPTPITINTNLPSSNGANGFNQGIPSITPTYGNTPAGFYPSHLPSGVHPESMVGQAKSQAGSRMLQTKLQANDPVFFASVFEEVYEALPELMVDLFGNYLVQKLIVFANDTQRLQLLLKVLPELLEISCDRQGTRAIQKLIESLKHQHERQMVLDWLTLPMPGQPPQPLIVETHGPPSVATNGTGAQSPVASPLLSSPTPSLSSPSSPSSASPPFSHPPMPRLIHLIRDQNGSHVVHSILDTFPQNMLHNVQRNAMKNCRSLGVDQHGLCVLKKCLSMAPAADFIYFNLKMILEHVNEYVNNQYGNYLIQHIIERTNGLNHAASSSTNSSHTSSTSAQALAMQTEQDEAVRPQLQVINDAIFRSLRGSFARLSRQKFSSNVVEKCLKIPDPNIRAAIVAELIEPDSIASLLQCSYGNYVLQNVLYVASQDECALLFARVRPEHVLASLRKNIRAKWERLLANAHLIHPGLAPGGTLLNGEVGPDGMSVPFNASGTSGAVYPSPGAIQLITSILGAGTPSTSSSSSTPNPQLSPSEFSNPSTIERVGTPSATSPSQISPSMRGLSITSITPVSVGNSPSFQTRNFRSTTPNTFRPTLDRRSSNPSSGVNSPHFNAANANSPQLFQVRPSPGGVNSSNNGGMANYSSSMNGATSPGLNYRGHAPAPLHGSNFNASSPQYGTNPHNYPVHSPNASPTTPTLQSEYHPHPRAPPSAHATPNFSSHYPSPTPNNFLSAQPSKFHTNPTGGYHQAHSQHSHPHSSPTPAGGNVNLSTPESIQQQIQNTQNQLQALMALQAAQAQVQHAIGGSFQNNQQSQPQQSPSHQHYQY